MNSESGEHFSSTSGLNIEKRLTPHQFQKIMFKLTDVNEHGTAHTRIDCNFPTRKLKSGESLLTSVLHHGILGTGWKYPGVDRCSIANETSKAQYEDTLAKGHVPEVFFSILGREKQCSNPQLRNAHYASEYFVKNDNNSISLIFDLEPYLQTIRNHGADLSDGYYSPTSPLSLKRFHTRRNELGEILSTDVQCGFRLSPNVPVERLKGIVFTPARPISPSPNASGDQHQMFKHTAHAIATEMLEAYPGHEERCLPIYDVHGNLWWPQEMRHAEIQRFVAQRRLQEAIRQIQSKVADMVNQKPPSFSREELNVASQPDHSEHMLELLDLDFMKYLDTPSGNSGSLRDHLKRVFENLEPRDDGCSFFLQDMSFSKLFFALRNFGSGKEREEIFLRVMHHFQFPLQLILIAHALLDDEPLRKYFQKKRYKHNYYVMVRILSAILERSRSVGLSPQEFFDLWLSIYSFDKGRVPSIPTGNRFEDFFIVFKPGGNFYSKFGFAKIRAVKNQLKYFPQISINTDAGSSPQSDEDGGYED